MIANKQIYLGALSDLLAKQWPENRTVNIVCHGHSVPSGYLATPLVDPFCAYPHMLHRILKERFPYAVLNVIVTGIGGENAKQGAARFERTVLNHAPDVLTIDYGLNDRKITLEEAKASWRIMIEQALNEQVKVILLTPSWEQSWFHQDENWRMLELHAEQIRDLAEEYNVGLADSFAEFQRYIDQGGELQDLLSHINHPSRTGHGLIAASLSRWFPVR